MKNLLLAIESSCDETAAAVLDKNGNIVSSVVKTQWIHSQYGGVVPELASREHIKYIAHIVDDALQKEKLEKSDIGSVAVTYGPGLIGALLVGISFAKAFAYAQNIPLIPINHLEGHIFASFYNENAEYKIQPQLPAIILIVSGGHTVLLYTEKLGDYQLIGQTRDDAAGEAFDKIAKVMNIGYPGGYQIDKLSKSGNPLFEKFPRAKLKKSKGFDFSFSGLKTAVTYYMKKKDSKFLEEHKADIAASFQEAVVDALIEKTIKAAKKFQCKHIYISGGVSRNSRLRAKMQELAEKSNIQLHIPIPELCTDNAIMIGLAGIYHWNKEKFANLNLSANPNLKIYTKIKDIKNEK